MSETLNIQTERKILTVSDLTRDLRWALEENFSNIWVEGEITNFKHHTSGHMYFTLKDENAQIQCVMFRGENSRLEFSPKDGLGIVVFGRVSVYPLRGQYQIYVERMEPKGIGALQLKFQELKDKLAKEGLFDAARKRPLPYLPGCIGIVTSLDGAALRDILHVIERRFQGAHIVIYPVVVQGPGSAASIAGAIEDFNEMNRADVLIVGRGGGSLEDLWAFNEEVVARAICASKIPVISAVGHEVDFTIADFVADLRAATPSAAAEIVLPVKEELILRVDELKSRAAHSMLSRLRDLKEEVETIRRSKVLRSPLVSFELHRQRLSEYKKTLKRSLNNFLKLKTEALASLIGKLDTLGPLAVLKRGFSMTLKLPGEKIVTRTDQLKIGDNIKTKLTNGFFISKVKQINA